GAGVARNARRQLGPEGAQLDALRGMSELLAESRIDYIVCQLNTFLADAQGESYDATRAYCERFGYTAYDLRQTARLQRIERPIVETGHLVTDLLFVSPRRTSLDG